MKRKKHFLALATCLIASLLIQSCALLPPKNADSDEIKCSVYAAVDEYLEENRSKSWMEEYFEDNLSMLLGKYKCKVPDEVRIDSTEVIDWDHSDNKGNEYRTYFVYYRILIRHSSYYALVALTEFKDGSYEWSIEDVEPTLSEVKSLVEIGYE